MTLTPEQIKVKLKKLGIRPDSYLGQNFLVDTAVLEQIVTTAQTLVATGDTVLEIGSGLGVLTQELVKLADSVVAVEKDPIFARALSESLGSPANLAVIEGDILRELEQDTSQLSQAIREGSWAVVANIPYAITSPLLRKLVSYANPPHHILVLVQRAAAERICAEPGNRNRGVLTIQLEILAQAAVLTKVPKEAFWPSPKVESALLLLTMRQKPFVPPTLQPNFFATVQAGFSAKRKQLQNSLAGGLHKAPSEIRGGLNSVSIDPTRRAETLTIDEWLDLTHNLFKLE